MSASKKSYHSTFLGAVHCQFAARVPLRNLRPLTSVGKSSEMQSIVTTIKCPSCSRKIE
jgi:hypothetical protein